MRNISLAIAIHIVCFSAGCSGSSTATSDAGVNESTAGQTDVGSETSDDNGESESNPIQSGLVSLNSLDGVGVVQRIESNFGFLEGPA